MTLAWPGCCSAATQRNRTQPNFYGFNFYDLKTNFAYAAINTDLGDGWKLEDKLYRDLHHNKQNYTGTTISASRAVDKLNFYVTMATCCA